MARALPPPEDRVDTSQVAFAEQIKVSLHAIASAVAPIPEGELDDEERGMAEAGLMLTVDAMRQLTILHEMFRLRRNEYFIVLYAEGDGLTQGAIGVLAGGMSDVLVGKVLRQAREAKEAQ